MIPSPDGPLPCPCLLTPFAGLERERDLGMDADFADASIWCCGRCDRLWLHYHYELEAFTGSGRWFLGLLPRSTAGHITAEQATQTLEALDWYYFGGSYFDGKSGIAVGPVPVP